METNTKQGYKTENFANSQNFKRSNVETFYFKVLCLSPKTFHKEHNPKIPKNYKSRHFNLFIAKLIGMLTGIRGRQTQMITVEYSNHQKIHKYHLLPWPQNPQVLVHLTKFPRTELYQSCQGLIQFEILTKLFQG